MLSVSPGGMSSVPLQTGASQSRPNSCTDCLLAPASCQPLAMPCCSFQERAVIGQSSTTGGVSSIAERLAEMSLGL